MTQLNLVDSFKEFKEFKNIDHEVMMGILEDVFRAMILKKYGKPRMKCYFVILL